MQELLSTWINFFASGFFIMSLVGGIIVVSGLIVRLVTTILRKRIFKKRKIASAKPLDYLNKACLLLLLIPFWILPLALMPAKDSITVAPLPSVDKTTVIDSTNSHLPVFDEPYAETQKEEELSFFKTLPIKAILLSAWVLVSLALLLHTGLSYILFSKRIKKLRLLCSTADKDEKLSKSLAECADIIGVKRIPTLVVCNCISSPMLVGINKPTLFFPSNITDDMLRPILLHELTHLKRGDLLYKLILRLACMLHWFNPAVWLLSKEASLCNELLCDEQATALLDIQSKKAYAKAIFSAINISNTNLINLSNFQANCLVTQDRNKNNMKKRFDRIMNTKNNRKVTLIVGAALFVCLLLAGGALGFVLADGFAIKAPFKDSIIPMTQESASGQTPALAGTEPDVEVSELPLTGKTIVIDPGHGGDDEGTLAATFAQNIIATQSSQPDSVKEIADTKEKTFNLLQAELLRDALKAQGATVVMTRQNDSNLSNEERRALAGRADADLFISIHHNSAGESAKPQGFIVYHSDLPSISEGSMDYANTISTRLSPLFVNEYKRQSYKIVADEKKAYFFIEDAQIPKIQGKDFITLRDVSYPAIHLEAGFLSSPHDLTLIASKEHQTAVAAAITAGIIDTITKTAT